MTGNDNIGDDLPGTVPLLVKPNGFIISRRNASVHNTPNLWRLSDMTSDHPLILGTQNAFRSIMLR